MRLKKLVQYTFDYQSTEAEQGKSKKTFWVSLLFVCLLSVILGNFAIIQFIKGDHYQKLASKQQNSWRTISASRGTITDCNGIELAVSVSANLISINPETIERSASAYASKYMQGVTDPKKAYQEKVAKDLAEILSLDYDAVLEKVQSNGRYKVIAEKISTETGDIVRAWISEEHIKGVYVDEDSKRVYPGGSLACHILGFTGKDDQGLVCGVELALDDLLTGTDGRILTAVDAGGNELPYDEIRRIEPINGYTAVLTLDANIQKIAENALKEAIEANGVKNGGTILVLNAKNADILGMASYPYFNLNDPYGAPLGVENIDVENWNGHTQEDVATLSATVWRNKALTDTYEPGSTFKTITAAIGIEENVIKADSIVNDNDYSLAGWTIHCWRYGGHGTETFAQAVKNSCNPVMAKLSMDIGLKKFYDYVEAFGFKDKTGIVLSGEAQSIFHTNPTEIDMAVTSFGQRFQVTPLQVATAYCAIANGGTLMQPRIVKQLVDDNGAVVKSYDVTEVRRVISESTSASLLQILESVVAEGTGSNAYVSGYRVAGKTGTSETTETDSKGRYIVSFAGIAPADNPEIVVLVVLDHPTIGGASGGLQAAPVAGTVIEKTLEYLEIERRYTELDKQSIMVKNYVPDVSGMTVAEAVQKLRSYGFSYILGDVADDGDLETLKVVEQFPKSGAYITDGSKIMLYTQSESSRLETTVPDLSGYSLEDAYKTLSYMGLNMQAENIGNVVSQSPAPGTKVPKGSVVKIELINRDTETLG